MATPQPLLYIKAKNNVTQQIVDANLERDVLSFTCISRFNGLGSWQLVLQDTPDNPSPHAATFLRDPVDQGLHNGILVHLDNQDGNGLKYVFSGPQKRVNVKRDASGLRTITASGYCEKYWLSKRQALPVSHFPYIYYASQGSNVGAGGISTLESQGFYNFAGVAVAFLPLLETSGTSAQNVAGAGGAGTYTGGFTLNQPSLLDDPNPSVLLNGTTGFISVPTTGMSSGNAGWSVVVWGMVSSIPSALCRAAAFGTNSSKQAASIGLSASGGFPFFNIAGLTSVVGVTAVEVGVPFMLALTYDGTIVRGYCFTPSTPTAIEAQFGTLTPSGGLSITYGAARLGAHLDGTGFWPGYLQMGGWYNRQLLTIELANLYAVGRSRQAYLAYDTVPLPNSSSQLLWYIGRNAGASGNISGYGLAAPSAAFTNWQGTQSARQVPGLAIPTTDPNLGSAFPQTIPARFDNLLTLAGAICLQSNPEIGFDIQPSGSGLALSIFRPQSNGNAVFSVDKGNLLEYEWEDTAADGNHINAGGANPGGPALTERIFGQGEDATSISKYGYVEGDFLDYRQAQDGPTLQQAVNAELTQEAEKLNINGTIVSTDQLYYKGPAGKGWDVGDIVTVEADGQTFQETIREVQIDFQPNAPLKITAAIGTPVAAEIMQELQTLQGTLKTIRTAQGTLKTNY